MIENGIIFDFDRAQQFKHGRCVTDVKCSTVCYVCRKAGCPHCRIAPRAGEKLALIRVDGRVVWGVTVDKCTLVADDDMVVIDVQMEITTHGKKRRLFASELVGYSWYTKREE